MYVVISHHSTNEEQPRQGQVPHDHSRRHRDDQERASLPERSTAVTGVQGPAGAKTSHNEGIQQYQERLICVV